MPKIVDLKSTLNLPRTTFPMKASLPQNEPKQLADWEEKKLYHRIQESRAEVPTYVLHDGPPYPPHDSSRDRADKILKDMVVKSKTMAGFRAPYIPGWDCTDCPLKRKWKKNWAEKREAFRRRIPSHVPRIRFAYVDQHRRDFKRRAYWGSGRPVSHDESEVRSHDCRRLHYVS